MEFRKFVSVSVGWSVYANIFFMRRPLSMVKGDLDFDREYLTTELGWLDFMFFASYCSGQLFFENFLSFRFNRLKKWLLLSTILSCAPITILFPMLILIPLFSDFTMYSMLLLALGFFQALSCSTLSRIIALHLPPDDTYGALGILSTSSLMGGIAGTFVTVYMQYSLGWSFAYFVPGLGSLVLSFIAFLVVSAEPADNKSQQCQNSFTIPSKRLIFQVMANSKVAVICIMLFAIRFVRFALFMWVPYFLLEDALHSQLAVGVISIALDFGGLFGTLLCSSLVVRFFHRRVVFCVLVCNIATATTLGFFYAHSYDIAASWFWLFMTGFVNSAADNLLVGPLSAELGENLGTSATLLSVVNGVGALGAITEGPIFSWLLKIGGWSTSFVACSVISILAAFVSLIYFPGALHVTSTIL